MLAKKKRMIRFCAFKCRRGPTTDVMSHSIRQETMVTNIANEHAAALFFAFSNLFLLFGI